MGINAGLGKAIASAGNSATMDVYNAMAKLVGSSPVPNYLFSKVNPQDAIAAYNGLLEFKDVVKAAQRRALHEGSAAPLLPRPLRRCLSVQSVRGSDRFVFSVAMSLSVFT